MPETNEDIIIDDVIENGQQNVSNDVTYQTDENGNVLNDENGNPIPVVDTTEDDPIFADNGDIVDKDGKVLKTVAEMEQELKDAESSTLTEEEETARLDAKAKELGITVDEVIAKEKADAVSTDSTGSTPILNVDISKFNENFAFDPKDKDGNAIDYDLKTEVGVQAYIKDLSDHVANVKMGEIDSAMVKRFPVLEDVIMHLQTNNGSLEGFGNTIDYENIDYTKLEDDAKEELIIRAEIARGRDQKSAESLAKIFKDSNQLDDQSKQSFDFLKNIDIQAKDNRKKLLLAQEQKNQDANTKYWNDIKSAIVSKQSIKGHVIPDVIRVKLEDGKYVNKNSTDFEEYLSKPVQQDAQGNLYSQWQIDKFEQNNKRTFEDDIYEGYLLFTGGDISSIVTRKANDNNAKQLKERYLAHLSKNKSGNNNQRHNNNISNDDIIV